VPEAPVETGPRDVSYWRARTLAAEPAAQNFQGIAGAEKETRELNAARQNLCAGWSAQVRVENDDYNERLAAWLREQQ
jgi:hypothetical protein